MEISTEASIDDGKVGQKLAPFNPSHDEVVEIALRLMALRDGDILYDLGCGDGRVMIKVRSSLSDILK